MRRLLTMACLTVMACGGGEQRAAGGDGDEMAAATAPLGTARIEGVALFQGSAPQNPALDMSEEPFCMATYEGTPRDPVVVVQERADGSQGLMNVFVRVVSGLPAGPYPQPGSSAIVDQEGCLYHPRVLGVVVGQELEILNSDSLSHNIKAVPSEQRGFNISQPRAGMSTTRTFDAPEIMVPLECSVHGWMQAYVGVVEHPYFATTGADGSFVIEGLPAGTYTLEAWHETMGTMRAENVQVSEGGTTSATFTFSQTG